MVSITGLFSGSGWRDNLQDASWRGIRFVVMDSETRRGRRTAVHEYPFRDVVWVEDLGRATRRYGFRGFAVGDDCYDIEQDMLDAAEVKGPGELIHPSLGSINATLVEFSTGQRRELGRVVEFTFGFIEGVAVTASAPGEDDTQDDVESAADDADTAAGGDFFDQVGDAISSAYDSVSDAVSQAYSEVSDGISSALDSISDAVSPALDFIGSNISEAEAAAGFVLGAVNFGISTVNQGVAEVEGFVGLGLSIIHDPARLLGAVTGLGGLLGDGYSLGRYAGGKIAQPATFGAIASIPSSVTRMQAGAGAALAGAVMTGQAASVAGNLAVVTAQIAPLGVVAKLQGFTAAVRAAANDPADAVRLLGALAVYDTAPVVGTSAIPQAQETMRAAVTAAARCAALAALARACAAYQPTSYDDAAQLRATAAALFDAAILGAADAGYRRTYLALRTLRTAVVADLTRRGAQLPRLTVVVRSTSLPALALAQQLYQDGSRAQGLIAGAGDVPCPAFMPLSFSALAQ